MSHLQSLAIKETLEQLDLQVLMARLDRHERRIQRDERLARADVSLEQDVHRPRPRVKLTRREIFRRDNYTCQYCGKRDTALTVDHVIPRHMGGQHIWTNLAAACSFCNHRKGGRKVEEAHMRLMHIPKEPPANAAYIFGKHLTENGEWEPYISGW